MKLSLSYATPFSDKVIFEYKNIVEMARMAGYNTIWISSASESGPFSGYVNAIQKSSDIYYDVTNHSILKKGEDLDLSTVFKSEYVKEKSNLLFYICKVVMALILLIMMKRIK